jgi:hypothetical protein
VLAACRSPHIVRYFASVLPHGSTKLAIAMELMAASAADLVRFNGAMCSQYQAPTGVALLCFGSSCTGNGLSIMLPSSCNVAGQWASR